MVVICDELTKHVIVVYVPVPVKIASRFNMVFKYVTTQ